MGFPRVDLASYAPDGEAIDRPRVGGSGQHCCRCSRSRERSLSPSEIPPMSSCRRGGRALGYVIDAVLADGPAVRQAVTQYFGEEPQAELEVVTETAFSIEAAEFEPFDEQVATAIT